MFDDYLGLPGPAARGLALKVVGYAAAIGLAVFFYHLYQVRMMVRRAQNQPGVVCKKSPLYLNQPIIPYLHISAVPFAILGL
jgi:hypothetical protein